MSTPASVAKHPFHPMLIVFPLGLWLFSFLCMIVQLATGSSAWGTTATYTLGGGLVGALVAAVPGFIDLLSIPPSSARTKGLWHAIANVTALIVFAIAFFIRIAGIVDIRPFWFSLAGVILSFIGGWLGGDMVYVNGVGVSFEGKEDRQQRMEQQRKEDLPPPERGDLAA